MTSPKRDGWYVRKGHRHFDLPLDFDAAYKLVTSPTRVASHGFLPFMAFKKRQRRFRKKNKIISVTTKDRDLAYPSHRDGYIHSYYALRLSECYERFLEEHGISNVVTGYRRGIGTNYDLAEDAFAQIRYRGAGVVTAIDIKNFFPTIHHRTLKENLQKVLRVERLPDDWYAVYRSMTKFGCVDLESVLPRLGIERASAAPRPLCTIEQFRALIKGRDGVHDTLVSSNSDNFGIPQGSPLSSIFSNVYMIEFDQAMSKLAGQHAGFYRRYSDDIIWISSTDSTAEALEEIERMLKHMGGTTKISAEKTETVPFSRSGHSVSLGKPITYLGFTFSGAEVRIRAGTLSRYYRNMTYAARRAATRAESLDTEEIHRRKLFRMFSHIGRNNFVSYAKRASRAFPDSGIRRQMRRHFFVLARKIRNKGL